MPILISTLYLGPVGAAITTAPVDDNWPMINHDLSHTGYSTSQAPKTNQILWTYQTGGAVKTSPAVVNSIVYFGSDDGYIYAVNALNGSLIWKYNTYGPVQSSPAVVDGVVYIGGYHSHAVFALNAYTGALIWSSPVNSVYPDQISSTAVANGLVYVDVQTGISTSRAYSGEVYAFNASTGNLAWLYFPVPGFNIASSPAIYGGDIYFCNDGGLVIALDAVSGKQLWSVLIQRHNESSSGSYSPLYCSVSVSNGLLYVGSQVQFVQALNASNGAFVWSNDVAGGVLFSTPAVANGVVYVSTTLGGPFGSLQSGGVTALDAKTGAFLWNHVVGSIRYSSPAVANGTVFVGSDEGGSIFKPSSGHMIYALNISTGATIWTYTTGSEVYSSPAVTNGLVYVGSNDGKVYAIGASQDNVPSQTPSVPDLPLWLALYVVISTIVLIISWKQNKKIKSKKPVYTAFGLHANPEFTAATAINFTKLSTQLKL
jgi:outer membrane protein assembly factor BamB